MPTAEQAVEQSLFQRKMERPRKMYECLKNDPDPPKASRYLFGPFVGNTPEEPDLETRVANLEKRLDKMDPVKSSLILSPTQSEIEFFSKGNRCQ